MPKRFEAHTIHIPPQVRSQDNFPQSKNDQVYGMGEQVNGDFQVPQGQLLLSVLLFHDDLV